MFARPLGSASTPAALRRTTTAALALVLGLGGLSACDSDGDLARRAWLHNTLVLDNQVFLEMDPQRTAEKFAKMDGTVYAFFRGTAGNYARDLAQAGSPGYLPTAFMDGAAADVALIGDPHLENIGTFLRARDGLLVIDFNDFDGATYGPFHFDVRRLAVSAVIAGLAIDSEVPGFAEATATAPERIAQGYVDELAALAAAGAEIPALTEATDDLGTILRDLVDKARENGELREELLDYTTVDGETRSLRFGAIDPVILWQRGPHTVVIDDVTVIPLAADDTWLIEPVLYNSYPTTVADPAILGDPRETLRLKGIGRRLGAGVASYPVRRYYALVEGPSADPDDDWLLELKQVFDPLLIPGIDQAAGTRPYADNGVRLVAMQRELQGADDLDPLLGYGTAGGITFRIRERTKYQRGVGIDRITNRVARERWDAEDFLTLATWAGRLLARTHARARKRDGSPGLPAIAPIVAGDAAAGFVAETVAFAAAYAPTIADDADHLTELLMIHGPNLGYIRR